MSGDCAQFTIYDAYRQISAQCSRALFNFYVRQYTNYDYPVSAQYDHYAGIQPDQVDTFYPMRSVKIPVSSLDTGHADLAYTALHVQHDPLPRERAPLYDVFHQIQNHTAQILSALLE